MIFLHYYVTVKGIKIIYYKQKDSLNRCAYKITSDALLFNLYWEISVAFYVARGSFARGNLQQDSNVRTM